MTICVVSLTMILCLTCAACGAFGGGAVGIASIEKTGTEGLVDTYTITMTDGTTSSFTVTNGKNGTDGADGASASGKSSGATATYTPDEYFRFNLLEDDTYEVSARYNDMPICVVIPEKHNGKSVSSIGIDAFYSIDSIDEIVVHKGIKKISQCAFWNCRHLTSIKYSGTKDEWESIEKEDNSFGGKGYVFIYTIYCSDGDIAIGPRRIE